MLRDLHRPIEPLQQVNANALTAIRSKRSLPSPREDIRSQLGTDNVENFEIVVN